MALMSDSQHKWKIKNNEVQKWRMELASNSYAIKYRPGEQNNGPDTFSRAFCTILPESTLKEIFENLLSSRYNKTVTFHLDEELAISNFK